MPVNKFGMSLTNRSNGDGIDGASAVRLRSSIESLRNYTRNNALFMSEDSYDAKERKIRRVAAPEIDDDETNRTYVDNAIGRSKKSATEELRGEITTVRNDALRLNEDSYDARERKIRRVVTPEVGTDAANKSYVEGAIGQLKSVVIEEIKKNDVTEELRSGIATLKNDALRLNQGSYHARERKIRGVAAPEVGTDVANRSYVEGAIGRLKSVVTEEINKNNATEELRSGIATLWNGALRLNEDYYDARESKIRRVATPEVGTDATNKSYVEGAIERLKSVVTEEIKRNTANEDFTGVIVTNATQGLRDEIAALRNDALLVREDSYDAEERRIRRVAAPEIDDDATNKGYVEGAIAEVKKDFRDLIREFRSQFVTVKNIVDKHNVDIGAIQAIFNVNQ